MQKTTLLNIQKRLRTLGRKGSKPINDTLGICNDIQHFTRVSITLIPGYRGCVEGWADYSGDMFYPVRSTKPGLTGYNAFYLTKNLWRGKTGELRRALCRRLARHIDTLL